jgi:hypothetical protein
MLFSMSIPSDSLTTRKRRSIGIKEKLVIGIGDFKIWVIPVISTLLCNVST